MGFHSLAGALGGKERSGFEKGWGLWLYNLKQSETGSEEAEITQGTDFKVEEEVPEQECQVGAVSMADSDWEEGKDLQWNSIYCKMSHTGCLLHSLVLRFTSPRVPSNEVLSWIELVGSVNFKHITRS